MQPNSGNNTASIEQIIYGSFVKYDRLEQQVFNTFSNTSIASATNLNIFIDAYSVLKSLFSEHYRTDISDYTAITTGLINMCSHYRSFFKRLSVNTRFFIIYSFNTCDINRKFVAEYNNEFLAKSEIKIFRDLANSNFELLNLLCPYLPDIFFIKSERNYESSVIMANLIENVGNGYPNLIISKDLYPLQLCYIYPYTSYLYPIKRRNGIDNSIMIPISEKFSFKEEFWNLISYIRKIDRKSIGNISPLNFVLFSSLHKFPERYITGITNVSNVRKIIEKLIGEEDIKIIPQQLYEDPDISSNIQVSIVESRMKALDVQFALPYYKNDPESKSIHLQNLQDNSTINLINSKFFEKNPIDINKL